MKSWHQRFLDGDHWCQDFIIQRWNFLWVISSKKEEIPSMKFYVSLLMRFHRWIFSSMKFYKYLYREISSMKFSMSNLLLRKKEIPSMKFFGSLWDFIDEKFHRWNISSMKFSMSNLLLWKRKFHRWIFLSLSPYEISSMKNFIDEIFHRWACPFLTIRGKDNNYFITKHNHLSFLLFHLRTI